MNANPSQGNEADDKAGLTLVASVENSWTSEEEWKKIPGQQSQPVALVEGELYYFEALHKEGWGGDHLSVGWLVPGRTDIEVIDTTSIAISIQPSLSPVIVQQPVSQEVALGENVTFTLGTEGPKLASYQWRLDGKPILGASLDPVLTLENIGAGHQGVYDCIYTAGDKVLTSVPVALKISGLGAVKSGGLWQELWEGMPGSTVIDLTADSRFPRWSDSSDAITSAETPSLGNKYGQRWTGWLTPDETTNYRFYVTADDAYELRLSTDDSREHLTLISSRGSWVGSREWSRTTPSDWISLVAGEAYYLELLHKEGGGGDHCAITWQKLSEPNPENGDEPIDGAFLSHRVGGPEAVGGIWTTPNRM